ncbi:MAG: serine/threonine protein kinase [Planctomycetes bacterium]|nr:serine/threonine protein kinase [Planctomycetota bacterium]
MGRCLTTDEIAALAGESLPETRSRRLMRHCAYCSLCQGQVDEWRANMEYAADVRRAVQSAPAPGSSEVAVAEGLKLPVRIVPLISRDSIKGYEILGEIHRGGQGVVYRAIQESTKREVAIKVALEEMQLAGKRPHRFDREVELASLLKHPSIITIFDSGTTPDGRCYFVMDYVRGLPVDQYVREHDLSIEQALSLFISICQAVNHAHQRGVIHRDLKPSNVLVDSEGVPRVLDFGLAKALGGAGERLGSVVSVAGQILGTVPYMAPEQLAGRPEAADIRTDVYALGVLVYEILAGCLPYDVSLPASQILRRITEGSPPPPSRRWSPVKEIEPHAPGKTRCPGCPIDDELDAIVLRALAQDPDRRYQSAADLARDLGRYLAGEPIEAKRERLYVFRKLLYRHRLPVSVAVGFFVVLATALTVITTLYLDVNRLHGVSEEQRQVAQSERDRAVQAQKHADSRAQELRRVMYLNHVTSAASVVDIGLFDRIRNEIYACSADLRGWEWYWLAGRLNHSWRVLRGHQGSVTALAVAGEWPRLISGGADGVIKLWNAERAEEVGSIAVSGRCQKMCVSPDGQRCAIWDPEGKVAVYETAGGKRVCPVEHDGVIQQMRFSPNSKLLAIGNANGWLELCDAVSGARLTRLGPHGASVSTVAFSPDGSLIATGSSDQMVRIWSIQERRELHLLRGHQADVTALAWSPDATTLASSAENGSLILWNAGSGMMERTILTRRLPQHSLAYSPDGGLLAGADSDQTVFVWDMRTGLPQSWLRLEETNLSHLVFSADARWLAGAGDDFAVRVWGLDRTPSALSIQAHQRASRTVAFGPDGRLASGGNEGIVTMWDVASRRLLLTLAGHTDKVRSLAFSPDGAWLVTGSIDKSIGIWDTHTGLKRKVLRGHKDCVLAVAVSRDGRLIASGGSDELLPRDVPPAGGAADYLDKDRDNSVRIWDAGAGTERMCLRGHRSGVVTVAFSPDGWRVASGSHDKTVVVWDLATRRPISIFAGHRDTVRRVLFSPDGKSVLSASDDCTVQTWDPETGKLLAAPLTHPKAVYGIALTSDGSRIATCGGWGRVNIWKRDSVWELLTLPSGNSTGWSVAFSADGTSLAAGTENGEIRVWRTISPEDLKRSPQAAEGLANGAMRLWSLQQRGDADLLFREAAEMHQTIFGPNDPRTVELMRRYESFQRGGFSEVLPLRNAGSDTSSYTPAATRPDG